MFFPNHLSSYHECPERYFHDRIERRKKEFAAGPELVRGIAIHHVLSDAAGHYQMHGTAPDDLSERTRKALPRTDYLSDESWEQDLETVIKEVDYGASVFDGVGTVLASEATYDYHYKKGRDCPPFMLAAKVDLVMLRHDADGKPFLDVMDFKSGAGKVDSIQELACRIVVKNHAKSFGVSFDYVMSSTVRTGVESIRSVKLDDTDFQRGWRLITEIVAAIIDGTDWHPIRSPLCEWCPYFTEGCSIAPDLNGADELGDWLDGVEL
jgi:hypothetical protein